MFLGWTNRIHWVIALNLNPMSMIYYASWALLWDHILLDFGFKQLTNVCLQLWTLENIQSSYLSMSENILSLDHMAFVSSITHQRTGWVQVSMEIHRPYRLLMTVKFKKINRVKCFPNSVNKLKQVSGTNCAWMGQTPSAVPNIKR